MMMLAVNCFIVDAGSCRPFVRLVQNQHEYETPGEFSVRRQLFFYFTCTSTTVVIFTCSVWMYY